MKKKIFVFDSNLAGRHRVGAARTAMLKRGAVYGQGYGLQGESFAIPTKDEELNTLPINRIRRYVESFIKFATLNPDMLFEVSRVGCGLGYEDKEIAPLFRDAPQNCILPAGWRNL